MDYNKFLIIIFQIILVIHSETLNLNMPKRKATASNQVVDEVVTKSKSVSKRVKSGDVGAGVFSIPPGFKTIWQLEEETKQTWHSYHQDIQVGLSDWENRLTFDFIG